MTVTRARSAIHNYANRGMRLEQLINHTNAQYAAKGIATIQKISTPWKIVRSGKKITGAFPEGDSTVDFMGEYGGHAICFEAKSCSSTSSFPLSNFEPHQIEFMRKWNGTKFAIIEFTFHNEIYFVPWKHLAYWWDGKDRKSIPYSFFTPEMRIASGNGVALDYLKFVEVSD